MKKGDEGRGKDQTGNEEEEKRDERKIRGKGR